MARHEEDNPVRFLIPIVLVIGAVGYLIFGFFRGAGSESCGLLAVIVALLVYLLTFVNIHIGIATIIFCIGISPEFSLGGFENLRLEDFVVPVVFLAWITRHIERREEFAPSPLKGPIVAYLVAMLIASLAGVTTGKLGAMHTILVFGKIMVYFLIYVIVLNNIRRPAELKAYVILMLITAAISASEGLRLYATAEVPAHRVMGPFGETGNIFAGYLCMNLAMLLGLVVCVRQALFRAFWLAVAVFVGYVYLMTLSRTAYIALFVGILAFGLLRLRRILVLGVVALVVIPLTAPDVILQRAATIGSILGPAAPSSFTARVAEWKGTSWQRFQSSPVIGEGAGSTHLGDVDNEYVRVAVDAGILGLAAFLWFLVSIWRMAIRAYDRSTVDPFHRGFAAGFAMAFLSIAVHGLGATSFTSIRTMEFFMVLTALATALYAHAAEWAAETAEAPEREPSAPRLPGPSLRLS